MNRFTDKLLDALKSGGAYSIEQIMTRIRASDSARFEIDIALGELRDSGRVEKIDGAYRLARPKAETQKGLF